MNSVSKTKCIMIIGFIVVIAFAIDEVIIFNIFDQKRKLLTSLYAGLFLVSALS